MMNKYRSISIFILVLVSMTKLTVAQEDLSLSYAIRLGLENNYDIKIEKKNVDISENNNSWGEAGLFPTLSASLQGTQSTNESIEVFSPFQPTGKTVSTGYSPNVDLNWNLLSIYNIKLSKSRLAQLQEQSEGNAEIVISNTIQSIILGYYVAVLEKRRLEEFRKQLELSGDKYKLVKLRNNIGSAVTSDLLLEESNYLTDSSNYISQRLSYNNAVRNLKVLLGEYNPDVIYNLTDDLVYESQDLSYDALVVKMENKNVDLRTQYLAQVIAKQDLELSRYQRYPTLSFGANYTYNATNVNVADLPVAFRTDRETGEVFDNRNTASANYGLNFTISFTLFNGGRINRAIQNAMITEDINNIRVDKMKNSLRKDLVTALDEYNSMKQLYEISDLRYQSLEKSLNISEEKYKNGTINSFDYRTVQVDHLLAAISRLQALFNLIDSQVTIMRLTGGIIETYKE